MLPAAGALQAATPIYQTQQAQMRRLPAPPVFHPGESNDSPRREDSIAIALVSSDRSSCESLVIVGLDQFHIETQRLQFADEHVK
jgi:hypothetical protein